MIDFIMNLMFMSELLISPVHGNVPSLLVVVAKLLARLDGALVG
jgi:hypothetical protein